MTFRFSSRLTQILDASSSLVDVLTEDEWHGDLLPDGDFQSTTPGTNVPMYDDSTMGSIFAVASRNLDAQGATRRIWFLPHADASPNLEFGVGSDYRVMEDHICEQHHDTSDPFYASGFGNESQIVIIKPVVFCGKINVFK